MKGRHCAAVFYAICALLLPSAISHSKNTGNSPESSPKSQKAADTFKNSPQSGPEKIYEVRSGDSLYRIAKIHKTTPEDLMNANGLKSDKIKIGQRLKVPATSEVVAKAVIPIQKINPAVPIDLSLFANLPEENAQSEVSEDADQPLRMRLVEAGFQMLGVRYRFGGSGKTGVDCSGLVKNLFSKFDIDLPRSSREQFKQGEKVDRDKLEVGDLVFFSSGGKTPTHVGIYIGNDKFLHAARKARQVIVSDLNKFWYTMRYLGARRIMDLWWEEEPQVEPEPAPEGE